MVIDCTKFTNPCGCGVVHTTTTRLAVIENGCLAQFDKYLAQLGLGGRRVAIYDENTYRAAYAVRPNADQEIILPAPALTACRQTTADVLRELRADTGLLIAVGGGTLHDITRYCAYALGVPFVSCPTAASTDSFCSNHCVFTENGLRTVLPGVAPMLVLADMDVISKAPLALARSGVGCAIGKFISLADWKIACIMAGQTPCPTAEAFLRQAAVVAQGSCKGIADGDEGAVAQLMYGLLLPGFAMQMQALPDPACGAEQHMAYLFESMPESWNVQASYPLGGRIGACAVTVADLYHRLAEIDDIRPYCKMCAPLREDWLKEFFGGQAADVLMKRNTPDCVAKIQPRCLQEKWADIRKVVAEIPLPGELAALLTGIGAKADIRELGVTKAKIPCMLQLAPCLSNQITLMRMLWMLKFRYAGNASDTRAPRNQRHADKAAPRVGKGKAALGSGDC